MIFSYLFLNDSIFWDPIAFSGISLKTSYDESYRIKLDYTLHNATFLYLSNLTV